jgi:hypothetical protein
MIYPEIIQDQICNRTETLHIHDVFVVENIEAINVRSANNYRDVENNHAYFSIKTFIFIFYCVFSFMPFVVLIVFITKPIVK